MNQTRIVEKTEYKGWSITVIEKRFNIAKPYVVSIHDLDGRSRVMFCAEQGRMEMIMKEITYASLPAAREAGKVAINFYMKPK